MFKQKFNMVPKPHSGDFGCSRRSADRSQGDITKDAIYIDAERRFDELEKETTKLHTESKK